jgi:hypothetical protein
MAKKAKIGDVLQILTSAGVAYAQITHTHKRYGTLLSVFSGFYAEAPDNFSLLVSSAPQFQAFFPAQSAVDGGLLSVVSNVPVADKNKKFPIFRTRAIGRDGQCGPWWVWDGESEKVLDRPLLEAERKYPIRGIISAPLLLERIEKGYRPETHDI